MPAGGVTLDNAADYMRTGSALINQAVLDAGDPDPGPGGGGRDSGRDLLAELTRRAAAFIAAVKMGRGE